MGLLDMLLGVGHEPHIKPLHALPPNQQSGSAAMQRHTGHRTAATQLSHTALVYNRDGGTSTQLNLGMGAKYGEQFRDRLGFASSLQRQLGKRYRHDVESGMDRAVRTYAGRRDVA
jgi:hypothetical protein